jgi:hypothetical protein
MAETLGLLVVACVAFWLARAATALLRVQEALEREERERQRREVTPAPAPLPPIDTIVPDQGEAGHELDARHPEACDVRIGGHGEVHWR